MKIKIRTEDGRTFNGMQHSVTELKASNRVPAAIEIEAEDGSKILADGNVVTKNNVIMCEVLGDTVVPLFFKRMRRAGLDIGRTTLRSIVVFGFDPKTRAVAYAVEISPRGELVETAIDDTIKAIADKIVPQV